MKTKTKTLLLVGLWAFGLFVCEMQAFNTISIPININMNEIVDPPQGYEEIALQGSLMFGVNPNAIVAGSSEDAVYIGFNQSFGNVNISIYNGMGGLVYNTVVNTNVQQVVIIPFTSAANGSYIVELSNAFGYADGEFERN